MSVVAVLAVLVTWNVALVVWLSRKAIQRSGTIERLWLTERKHEQELLELKESNLWPDWDWPSGDN